MACYQNSIKNFSWLISACGAFHHPSGWANFPSMIPDPLRLSHRSVSSHTADENPQLVCLLHEMIPGDGLHRQTSLRQTSVLVKTRSPPFVKQSHLQRTIQSTSPCKLYKACTRCWGWGSPLPTWKHGSGVTCRPCWLEKRWQKYSTDQILIKSNLFFFF